MRPERFEDTETEVTAVDRAPWFEDDFELEQPDLERLRTSTAALRITLDRLERNLTECFIEDNLE